MKSYNTMQKKAIIDVLSRNSEKQFTVDELAETISAESELNSKPGKSTVYRLISKLVEDGTVKRFVKGQSRHFLYQLAGCDSHAAHLHMKCTSCGKLFHMDNDVSESLLDSVMRQSGFSVDEEKTVLFGKCRECK